MTKKRVVNKKVSYKKEPFFKRKGFLWSVGSVLTVVVLLLIAFKVSPWPGALVIRAVFDTDSAKSKSALAKHEPSVPITALVDQPYDMTSGMKADVYFPTEAANSKKELPVIIWTHGGAWISGSKNDRAPYFKLLAAEGFTVIAPDYTLAPEKTYPAQLQELNNLYAYIKENHQRFYANTNSIFLAGDSAGSQLSSQMAAIVTDSHYANEVGIKPNLTPDELDGVILFCGIYKMHGLTQPSPELPKLIGWGDDIAVWSYAGTKDFSSPIVAQMSPYYHVTNKYPATFISGGNDDPLTADQSKPFADKLQDLGVSVTRHFFEDDHQPKLPHEYQFNLDNDDGQKALTEAVTFARTHAK
jgi:acetyl esterase/lipase